MSVNGKAWTASCSCAVYAKAVVYSHTAIMVFMFHNCNNCMVFIRCNCVTTETHKYFEQVLVYKQAGSSVGLCGARFYFESEDSPYIGMAWTNTP